MRFQVSGVNLELTDGLRQHAERRLRFALGRFDGRIRRVSMQIFGSDDPIAGVEQRCQTVVHLIPSGRIVTQGTGDDLYAAIDWVAERTGQAIRRELIRRWDQEGQGCA